MVDTYSDLAFQCFPRGFRISRPYPATPAGDAEIAVAMQAPGTDVWKGGKGPLVIHLVAFDAFVEVEPVAFIRPEGVRACLHQCDMLLPIVLDMSCVQDIS